MSPRCVELPGGMKASEYPMGRVMSILTLKRECTMSKLEQYDYQGAAAIGVVMLIMSLAILFLVNLIQWWSGRRTGHVLTS